jgi:hypothetical protein
LRRLRPEALVVGVALLEADNFAESIEIEHLIARRQWCRVRGFLLYHALYVERPSVTGVAEPEARTFSQNRQAAERGGDVWRRFLLCSG